MAQLTDFPLYRLEDGTLQIVLAPQANISGASVRFEVTKRFGGTSGLILKYANSGYNNVSGINVTNGANGVFNVAINSSDTSGWNFGNYAFTAERLSSGSRKVLAEGYLQLLPPID